MTLTLYRGRCSSEGDRKRNRGNIEMQLVRCLLRTNDSKGRSLLGSPFGEGACTCTELPPLAFIKIPTAGLEDGDSNTAGAAECNWTRSCCCGVMMLLS